MWIALTCTRTLQIIFPRSWTRSQDFSKRDWRTWSREMSTLTSPSFLVMGSYLTRGSRISRFTGWIRIHGRSILVTLHFGRVRNLARYSGIVLGAGDALAGISRTLRLR